MDGLPADGLQDIRQLRRDVLQAQKTAGSRPAATRASKGWKLGSDDPPDFDDLDPGEVHIRSEDNSLVVRSQDGDIVVREVPRGGAVLNPVFESSALGTGAAVNGGQYNELREDAFDTRNQLINLLDELRAAGFIDT